MRIAWLCYEYGETEPRIMLTEPDHRCHGFEKVVRIVYMEIIE